MHVDAPSSMMHRWMVMFQTMTGIWKATKEGSRGSELSKSKVIRRESKGSTVPNVDSNDLFCKGHVCKTSSIDTIVGHCAKSSSMLGCIQCGRSRVWRHVVLTTASLKKDIFKHLENATGWRIVELRYCLVGWVEGPISCCVATTPWWGNGLCKTVVGGNSGKFCWTYGVPWGAGGLGCSWIPSSF